MITKTYKIGGNVRVGMAATHDIDTNAIKQWQWAQPSTGFTNNRGFFECLRASDGKVFGVTPNNASSLPPVTGVYQGFAGNGEAGATTIYSVVDGAHPSGWSYTSFLGEFDGGQILANGSSSIITVHGFSDPPYLSSQTFGSFLASWDWGIASLADGTARLVAFDLPALQVRFSSPIGVSGPLDLSATVILDVIQPPESFGGYLEEIAYFSAMFARAGADAGFGDIEKMPFWHFDQQIGDSYSDRQESCSSSNASGNHNVVSWYPNGFEEPGGWQLLEVKPDGLYVTLKSGLTTYPPTDSAEPGRELGGEVIIPGMAKPKELFWTKFVSAFEETDAA